MKYLVLGELARFRTLALTFALVHLAILRISMALYPLFAQDAAKTSVGILAYSLLGLGSGLYQVGSYRKPNLWAWLINRPLPISRIFLALASAAALLAALVVALPVLLITLYADFFTAQWVDARHYTLAFFLFGLVMAFYGVGSFMASGASRLAVLVGVLPIFFLTREAVGQWIFLPLLIVLAWLAYLAHASFQPELGAPLKRPLALVAAAVPIGYALLFVMSVGIVFVRSTWIIVEEHGPLGFATFAWNDYWDEGHVPHVDYLPADEALAHGVRLAARTEGKGTGLGDRERAAELLGQLDLADVYEVPGPRFSRFPRRHQPFFVDQRHELVDEENGTWWTFSHDLMRFVGRDMRTNEAAGGLGREGFTDALTDAVPFEAVPFVIENRFIVTPHHIRELDFDRRTLEPRFELPEGEVFTTPFREHRSFVVAKSDRRLYFFDPRGLELGTGPLEPLGSVALPDVPRNISRILVAEMIDSYLVSFVVGAQSFRGYHDAYQRTVELPIDGLGKSGVEAEVVGNVPLAAGFPGWYRHRTFLLSPVLQTVHDLAWTAVGPHRETRIGWNDLVSRPLPAAVLGQALLLALWSAGAAFGLARRRRLPPGRRAFWAVLAFVLGVPGLLASIFLARADESAAAADVRSSPRAVALGLLSERVEWGPEGGGL